MANLITVTTPDGQTHKHSRQANYEDMQVRTLADGSLEVISVRETSSVKSFGAGVTRPGFRSEDVVGTYPSGSTYTTR